MNITLILALMLILLTAGLAQAKPEIIAHRGASFDAPENTLGAVNLAWKLGADAVEIDVYLTNDHRIVVIHDYTTNRTSGVEKIVANSSFDELRTLDVGNWKDKKWAGQKIPSLEEVLKTVPRGKRLFVEIKCGPEIVQDFFRVVSASGISSRQLVVISFNSDVIKEVEARRPRLKTYFLCQPTTDNVDDYIRHARDIRTDGINGCHQTSFDASVVEKLREAKLGVYVWTVDDDATAMRYAEMGVDGITTNKPAEIKALLSKPQ